MYKIIKQGSCKVFGKALDKKAKKKFYDIPAYCLYLELNNRKILIDTGYNQEFFSASKKFPERIMRYITPVKKNTPSLIETLRKEGISFDENINILISHWHPDHIGSLKEVQKNTIYASTLEYRALTSLNTIKQVKYAFLKGLVPKNISFKSIETCKKLNIFNNYFHSVYDIFSDNSIYAVSLFGHSPNQYGFYIPKYEILYVADAVYTERNLLEDEKLHSLLLNIAWDKLEAKKTFVNLKSFMEAYPNTKLITSHDIFLISFN